MVAADEQTAYTGFDNS